MRREVRRYFTEDRIIAFSLSLAFLGMGVYFEVEGYHYLSPYAFCAALALGILGLSKKADEQ